MSFFIVNETVMGGLLIGVSKSFTTWNLNAKVVATDCFAIHTHQNPISPFVYKLIATAFNPSMPVHRFKVCYHRNGDRPKTMDPFSLPKLLQTPPYHFFQKSNPIHLVTPPKQMTIHL
jgi:hypothetical protein